MSDSTATFGVHVFANEADRSEVTEASRTGIVFYSDVSGAVPQVLSFVNGSMCINPVDQFVCSVNFDEYALDVFDNGQYRNSKGADKGEPGLAYFNPATKRYQFEEVTA